MPNVSLIQIAFFGMCEMWILRNFSLSEKFMYRVFYKIDEYNNIIKNMILSVWTGAINKSLCMGIWHWTILIFCHLLQLTILMKFIKHSVSLERSDKYIFRTLIQMQQNVWHLPLKAKKIFEKAGQHLNEELRKLVDYEPNEDAARMKRPGDQSKLSLEFQWRNTRFSWEWEKVSQKSITNRIVRAKSKSEDEMEVGA